ncbi:branched-chain alpha-keto acid dehydrogenase E2 subunit (lipoamide acyltransferase) [[Clostridium] ultunense Esp]|nr:branched-chain alpha-keto acid dehydrogenase E2 subunit (lipoamide acyltransferase) [[Clostridium] ultunense Esp]
MIVHITMPQLGESVTEGILGRWLVKPGDQVNVYDPLCEVITDKVNAEVPSTVAGRVAELLASENEAVPVGKVICTIETEKNEEESASAEHKETFGEKGKADPGSGATPFGKREAGQRLSPAVLKLAAEKRIPLEKIRGTGAGGRITRKDLLLYLEEREKTKANVLPDEESKPPVRELNAAIGREEEITKPSPLPVAALGDVEIDVTPVRRTIAERMVRSKHEAPHAWMMIEVDATNLVKLRNGLKEEFKRREGFNLTYLPFFIKAVVEALKEFPMLNAQWAKDRIIMKKEVNISIAVATDDALFVPVIKRADEKSVLGLARSIEELVRKTREGRLAPDDISGGTFTVNNTGSFGSVLSMPIINSPQAAILSIEAIVKRPVVIEGMIAVRDMVNLTLSLIIGS